MIRHTPVRTTRREKAGSLFWSLVAIVFGWTLFVYWWWEVLNQDQPAALLDFLAAIGFFILIFVLSTFLWIGHNREIARTGTRGRSSRYRVAVFTRDVIGRPLVLPARAGALSEEAVIRIDISGESKVYSPERMREDEATG